MSATTAAASFLQPPHQEQPQPQQQPQPQPQLSMNTSSAINNNNFSGATPMSPTREETGGRGKAVHFTQTSIGAVQADVLVGTGNKNSAEDELNNTQKKGKWHVNAMGSIIYKEHDSYDLMRQIQMGIRTAVSEVTPKRSRELTARDFSLIEKLSFPNTGTHRTPPHDHPAFVFYDYAPLCFRHLRERFGIDAAHFMLSVCHDQSLSILGTPGKSGALFFFSQDMKYILKTVTKKESKFLRRILSQYYNHVMANPSTLITRFYGLYSIKPTGQLSGNNVRFIVMNNVFDTQKDVLYRYDLKGSTVGREASAKERGRTRPVLKDLDFMDEGRRIRVGPKMKAIIMEQLKSDCKFLESMKIMDYSLLLGVHTFPESELKDYMHEMDHPTVQQHPYGSNNNFTTTTSKSNIPPSTAATTTTSTSSTDIPFSEMSSRDERTKTGSIDGSDETTRAISVAETPASSSQEQTIDTVTVATQETTTITTTTTTTTIPQIQTPDLKVTQPELISTTNSVHTEKRFETSAAIANSLNNHHADTSSQKSVEGKLFANRLSFFTQPHIQIEKHFHGEDQTKFQKFHGGLLAPAISQDGKRDIYFVGIIDILQKWNNKKQLENIFKSMKYDKHKISSVNPKNYAHRFCDFVEKVME